jgi:hypothetical protein
MTYILCSQKEGDREFLEKMIRREERWNMLEFQVKKVSKQCIVTYRTITDDFEFIE